MRGVDGPGARVERVAPWSAAAVGLVGAFVAGWPAGLLAAVATLAAPGAVGPAPLAGAAAAFLAVAAVATVLEGGSSVGLDYALARPTASGAARLAGAATLAALAVALHHDACPPPSRGREGPRRRWRPALGPPSAALRRALPWLGPVALAVVVRWGLGPAAVDEGAASSLALGRGPGATSGPLGPAVDAFAPFGRDVAGLAVAAGAALALVGLARRVGARPVAAAAAGATAAVVPMVVNQDLGAGLATALLATALLVMAGAGAGTEPLGPRSGAVVGLCLGGAVLARPEAVVAALVVGTVLWRAGRRSARRAARLRAVGAPAALIVAMTLIVAPWWLWLHDRTGAWWALEWAGWGGWVVPLAAGLSVFVAGAYPQAIRRPAGGSG